MPALLAFLNEAPALSLELDLTDRTVDMVAERVDIAVRVTAEPLPSFVERRVGDMHRVFCATPVYLRAHGVPRAPTGLRDHSCLTLSGPGFVHAWQLDGQTIRRVASLAAE